MQGVRGSSPLSSTNSPAASRRPGFFMHGAPAQLVAALLDRHAGGQGFESPQLHQLPGRLSAAGVFHARRPGAAGSGSAGSAIGSRREVGRKALASRSGIAEPEREGLMLQQV